MRKEIAVRFMRVSAAATLWLAGAVASPAQRLLTLDEAVTLASAHSRSVQRAALGPDMIADQMSAVRTQRLPQFSLTAFAGELVNRPSILLPGSAPGSTERFVSPERPITFAFAQANVPLSDQYKIGLRIRNLELEKQLKTQEVRGVRADIVAAVKDVYYQIILSDFDLKTADYNTQQCVELERVTAQYYGEKTVLRSELLNVQVRCARTEYDAVVLRDRVAEQKESMNSLLGRRLDEDFKVSALGEANADSPGVAELREVALAANPSIRQARIRVEQAKVAERIKRSEYIPETSLSMNYISTTGLPGTFPQKVAAAGVLVAWNPFDWGKKRHESSELARAEKQATLALKDEEDKVQIAVGVQVRKLAEARQLIAAARINQDRAQEEARVMQVRYSTNAALMKTVLETQAAAAAAQAETHKALTEYWEAAANLEKIMGGR